MLLAQGTVEMMPLWIQISGGVISLGFAVWYAWYVTTRTIPDMNTRHAETIQKLVDDFRQKSREQRELHRTDIAQFWAAHREESERLQVGLRQLADAVNRHLSDD